MGLIEVSCPDNHQKLTPHHRLLSKGFRDDRLVVLGGDGSLRYIEGSHLIDPREADKWVNAGAGVEQGQVSNPTELPATDAELPRGSMVFIDARMYHAVYDKRGDSGTTRPFCISIFKEADVQDGLAVPHRYTQPIPDC